MGVRPDDPSGPYHLVWSRDLYQIATGLIAAGDRAGANRALDFLFGVQQKPDGSFPQNSQVDGTPVWGGLQLDEVALPIVLAYQLGRTDAESWQHVRLAADFLVAFRQAASPRRGRRRSAGRTSRATPPTPSPTEIAGLVCAAPIARAHGDRAVGGPRTSRPPTPGSPGSSPGRSPATDRTRPSRTSCA